MCFLLEWGCQITNPLASMRCVHDWRWSCHDSNTEQGPPDPSHQRVVKSLHHRIVIKSLYHQIIIINVPGKSHSISGTDFAGSCVRGRFDSATDWVFRCRQNRPIAFKYSSNWVYLRTFQLSVRFAPVIIGWQLHIW